MRRRGIIRGNFSKLGILCLALVIAMGSLGIGLAMWSDTLTISGTMTTGEWVQCGTGYAYGGEGIATCFLDMEEINSKAWGWTNGPLEAGSYTFDIYAGAGKCDITKGELAGTLTVVYDGTTVTVIYNMNPGYTMDITHLYVGNEPLPTKKNGKYTTAPGLYGNTHDLDGATTDDYEISGLSGDIYVVAHAVVCWFDPSPL